MGATPQDNHHTTSPHNMGLQLWDSITASNQRLSRKDNNNNPVPKYSMKRLEQEYSKYTNSATGDRILAVPYVQPTLDDVPMVSNKEEDNNNHVQATTNHGHRDGKTYEEFWNLAKRIMDKNPCDRSDPREFFILIHSFNNWHDLTAIEPGYSWGNDMLSITRDRSRSFLPSCDPNIEKTN